MDLLRIFRRKPIPVASTADDLTGQKDKTTTEQGNRTTPENQIRHLYRMMWVDPEIHQRILDVRRMDTVDGRVKKIHTRMARSAVKGGLMLEMQVEDDRIVSAFKQFVKRLKLNKIQKLESDARGLVMEGNLPLQWVLNNQNRIVQAIRMPTETIRPNVGENGTFDDVNKAYSQIDITAGKEIASFAKWQLSLVRLTPDNYDDEGSLGRPYLDATRSTWQQLRMTEEDLVIRRRQRAPLRTSHVLEGATADELQDYKDSVENDQQDITTDYFANKKGGVTPIQGDANLDQIADVSYLLDTFFAGSPAPKGLFGYVGDINRDILEDLKKDYYEEIDAMQDTQAEAYEHGFKLDLLLQGINPEDAEFTVKFAERRTDTPNQRADLALKHQAIGVPPKLVWKAAGLDASAVLAARKDQENSDDPYPTVDGEGETGPPKISITPGNSPKGESMTSVSG
ncbi:MAG: hypothetical protein COB22_05925 [Cycloclasticus sp.]|nr:MAG: hypothetical protein COB22_05925 [Cycloclasticus sp.]